MVMPHCMSRLKTKSRSFSGVLATVSAPLVENGLEGDDLVREAYGSEEFRRTVQAFLAKRS